MAGDSREESKQRNRMQCYYNSILNHFVVCFSLSRLLEKNPSHREESEVVTGRHRSSQVVTGRERRSSFDTNKNTNSSDPISLSLARSLAAQGVHESAAWKQ